MPGIREWACQERFHLRVGRSEHVGDEIWCALGYLACRNGGDGPVLV
ncbi:hypothetical protein ACFW6S_26090 [Streptomyces sp. NPDC058740]